jgi:hypothetical protein
MKVDECRATVFLHEPLRRSLAMWLGGKEVASMHTECSTGAGFRLAPGPPCAGGGENRRR